MGRRSMNARFDFDWRRLVALITFMRNSKSNAKLNARACGEPSSDALVVGQSVSWHRAQ